MAKKPRTRTIVPGSIQLNTDNVKCLKIHNNNKKNQSSRETRFKFPAVHLQKMENLKRLLLEWRSWVGQ